MAHNGIIKIVENRRRDVTISFIIPTYNEEKFLRNVLRAITQNVGNPSNEIIIVDNGSTDSTLEIAREFEVRILQDSSRTIAGLRNLGALHAAGRILAFIDGDVVITKEWANNIPKVICSIEHNDRVITGSRYGVREDASWIERYWFLPMMQEKANYINGGNLIIKRDIFFELGGFADALVTSEDWEFCMRAKQKGVMIINNPDLHVIHEGYPKTLAQFIRKEKWHGIQDVYDLRSFIRSKPAMFGVLYWLCGIMGIILSLLTKSAIHVSVAIVINSTMCILATMKKRKQFQFNIIFYFLLYNVYFFARGLSLVGRLFQKNYRVSK